MKAFLLSLTLLVSGCATTVAPVTQRFPPAPVGQLEECASLQQVPADETSIVEFLKVVVENYGLYHECAIKNQTWIEWYKQQKELFDQGRSK